MLPVPPTYITNSLSITKKTTELLRDPNLGIMVNSSNGADSVGCTMALQPLLTWMRRNGWIGKLVLFHAHLGNGIAWEDAAPKARRLAEKIGAIYDQREREQDMIEYMWAKQAQKPQIPTVPSPGARWCTSLYKSSLGDIAIRHHWPNDNNIINILALRSAESDNRAGKQILNIRKGPTAPTKARFVYDWLPVKEHTKDQMFKLGGIHGGIEEVKNDAAQFQIAMQQRDYAKTNALLTKWDNALICRNYIYGMSRSSCVACVLASKNDLIQAIKYRPDVFSRYIEWEVVTGYSFKRDLYLSDLAPHLLTHEQKVQLEKMRGYPVAQPKPDQLVLI